MSINISLTPAPKMMIANKKESVELFVNLAIGIWRGPSTNKQYPTLVQYEVGTESAVNHTNTSDECQLLIPVLTKSPNFITKD